MCWVLTSTDLSIIKQRQYEEKRGHCVCMTAGADEQGLYNGPVFNIVVYKTNRTDIYIVNICTEESELLLL